MNNYRCTELRALYLKRNSGYLLWNCLLAAFMLSACAQAKKGGPPFSIDLLPPLLQRAEVIDERHIRFVFDESVMSDVSVANIDPPLRVSRSEAAGNQVDIFFLEDQTIGRAYTLKASVKDRRGNTLSFLFEFTGWNPRVPDILINEINPRGSGKTPDCIELYTLSDGNLGGLCLRIGTTNRYSEQIVFPSVDVSRGDFIVVHAKAEGLSEEIDEVDSIDESGGLLASDDARDFWIPESPGLPSNNGAVTLYRQKGGEVLDAVIWSDRSDSPTSEKLGWTSAGYVFASDLGNENAWQATNPPIPTPSEAVDISHSTATRSLCRASVPVDTNSSDDWHTVPTRGASFGDINADQEYSP